MYKKKNPYTIYIAEFEDTIGLLRSYLIIILIFFFQNIKWNFILIIWKKTKVKKEKEKEKEEQNANINKKKQNKEGIIIF